MEEPENHLNIQLAKVHPTQIFSKPLEALIDICGSIEAPSLPELKEMLRNYKVTEGDFWYSIFVCKWNEFYDLPELLKTVAKKYSKTNPELAALCYKIFHTVENCRDEIDVAFESRPNLQNVDSVEIEESFYISMVKPCHRRLKRICNDLRIIYSPKINEALKISQAQEVNSAAKNLVTDRQLEIWNLLETNAFTAKELASKSDSTEVNIRKIIQKIRKHFGKDSIRHRSSRGYWRPDAPPPDYSDVTQV